MKLETTNAHDANTTTFLPEKIQYCIKIFQSERLLVARSRSGICAVIFGKSAEQVKQDLQNQFPVAVLLEGDIDLKKLGLKVSQFINAPHGKSEFPLDLRGTDFQRRVWSALMEIPVGQTRTYKEIAQQIGSPNSVRAVGTACAANAIAVLVPCHRAVRNDGNPSGYRWGLERKQALLDREALTPS